MFKIIGTRRYTQSFKSDGKGLHDYKYHQYELGEKINIFDNLLNPTLKEFSEIFNIRVEGNLELPVEILDPIKSGYIRRVKIGNKVKNINMFPTYFMTESRLDHGLEFKRGVKDVNK